MEGLLVNAVQKDFSGLFKITFNFLGFMQGSFDVREVGQPPKVGIFSEMENTV